MLQWFQKTMVFCKVHILVHGFFLSVRFTENLNGFSTEGNNSSKMYVCVCVAMNSRQQIHNVYSNNKLLGSIIIMNQKLKMSLAKLVPAVIVNITSISPTLNMKQLTSLRVQELNSN